MKVGIITTPNQKGQIVIPKEFREQLGIENGVALNLILRGNCLYLYPVDEVITKVETESSYFEILKRTQGAWLKENLAFLRKKRKKIELKASLKRKKAW